MWNILLQAAAGLLIGAAVGYSVTAIIDTLSRAFAELWEDLVAGLQEIWGYVTEASEYCLATIAQILDNNWSEIKYYLRQEFGYIQECLVAVFLDGSEVLVEFIDHNSSQGESICFQIGELEPGTEAQLPSSQNPLVTELSLT